MGIVDAIFDSVGGTFQDQWKDIVTAGPFDEHTLVAPGIRKRSQNERGMNKGAEEILSNGSKIFVPENTAAFIFSQSGIEEVITQPGGYEYRNGQATVFDKTDRAETGIISTIVGQSAERIGFSGMSPDEKRIAFINLREIRGIKYGTRGPLVYHDLFYQTDLEIFSYGSISIQIVNTLTFVRNFLPPNTFRYTVDDPKARRQLTSEFLHSFIAAVNGLSNEYRISSLPGQTNQIAQIIANEEANAGTWEERFGIKLASIAIENIEFSDESRELVRQYSERRMNVAAYEGLSEQAANVAAQQLIAEGVHDNGLGEGGGMLFGMGLAMGLDPTNASARGAGAGGVVGGTIPGAGTQNANATDTGTSTATGQAYTNGADINMGATGSATNATNTNATESVTETPATSSNPEEASVTTSSIDNQIEMIKKLKELVDAGILTQEEFDAKKKDILGL